MLEKYDLKTSYVNGCRVYHCPGNYFLPSTTTVTSRTKPRADVEALNEWREKVGVTEAQRISKEACDRGNLLHQAIEYRLEHGIAPEISEEIQPWYDSLAPFLDQIQQVALIEGCVWDLESRFAGRVDCIAVIDDELVLCDWKTSSKPKRQDWILDYRLQATAYRQAVKFTYGLDIERAVVAIALPLEEAQIFMIQPEDWPDLEMVWGDRLSQFRDLGLVA